MRYFINEHHGLAVCGRDIVILDQKGGHYTLVAGGGTGIGFEGNSVDIGDIELAEAMTEAGVLQSDPPTSSRERPPALPTRSALDAPAPSAGVSHWVATLLAGIEMPVRYHARTFAELLIQAERHPAIQQRDRCDGRLIAAAAAFDRLSPWVPLPGECLFRSFMLLEILRRRGYRPRWVFGVRTWPFAAHCWLQAGEVALTDYADSLVSYTPILAI